MRLILSLMFLAALGLALAGVLWLIQATTLPHQVIAGAIVGLSLLVAAVIGVGAVAEDQSKQEIALLRAIHDRLGKG